MTNKEINIAIAKTCGKQVDGTGQFEVLSPWKSYRVLPNYCDDLNAMREAVSSMDEEKRTMWFNNLCDIVNMEKELALDAMSLFALINATAYQRAEAFLKTVGKWKE